METRCKTRGVNKMYSRDYPTSQSSGAVKAFEDAYAKEEFLRRSADMAENSVGCTAVSKESPHFVDRTKEETQISECARNGKCIYSEKDTAKHKNGLAGIFGNLDTGDIILVLLILFFLLDSDKENDSIIPIILAALLLF